MTDQNTPFLQGMSQSEIDDKLADYEQALNHLAATDEKTPIPEKEKQSLIILKHRDQLGQLLATNPSALTLDQEKRLITLDEQLRAQAQTVVTTIDLTTYRRSRQILPQAWWWYLDRDWIHPGDRFDWVWKVTRLSLTTVNLALITNFATRLFSSGSGFLGALAIVVPGLLTLFQANSEITKEGEAQAHQLLGFFNVPPHRWEEAKLIATIVLFVVIGGLWWKGPPLLSQLYTNKGLTQYNNNRLARAEENFKTAVSLNPDNNDAQYTLGVIYEDLGNNKAAEAQYRIAFKGGEPLAYNNLGRLLILADKPDDAAQLLWKGLEIIDGNPTIYPEHHFTFWKNLGWARLKQKRYSEAEVFLQKALEISESSEAKEFIKRPAAAHCLLALVLESKMDEQKAALEQWRQCQQKGKIINLDEDKWLGIACQRLKREENPCGLDD